MHSFTPPTHLCLQWVSHREMLFSQAFFRAQPKLTAQSHLAQNFSSHEGITPNATVTMGSSDSTSPEKMNRFQLCSISQMFCGHTNRQGRENKKPKSHATLFKLLFPREQSRSQELLHRKRGVGEHFLEVCKDFLKLQSQLAIPLQNNHPKALIHCSEVSKPSHTATCNWKAGS